MEPPRVRWPLLLAALLALALAAPAGASVTVADPAGDATCAAGCPDLVSVSESAGSRRGQFVVRFDSATPWGSALPTLLIWTTHGDDAAPNTMLAPNGGQVEITSCSDWANRMTCSGGEYAQVQRPSPTSVVFVFYDFSSASHRWRAEISHDGPRDAPDPQPLDRAPDVAPVPGVGTDADGDGVPDASDDCPKVPGSPDFDGCPPDSDGDKVPDAVDPCPHADAGYEGHDGCPAPWRKRLHVASVRVAAAIHRFWRAPARRAAFRRTLRMPIRIRLPSGLPRGRPFSVDVTFADRPLSGGLLGGRARCRPGHACRVVLRTERYKLPGFTPRERRRHRYICSTSMVRPKGWSDSETVPLRF